MVRVPPSQFRLRYFTLQDDQDVVHRVGLRLKGGRSLSLRSLGHFGETDLQVVPFQFIDPERGKVALSEIDPLWLLGGLQHKGQLLRLFAELVGDLVLGDDPLEVLDGFVGRFPN